MSSVSRWPLLVVVLLGSGVGYLMARQGESSASNSDAAADAGQQVAASSDQSAGSCCVKTGSRGALLALADVAAAEQPAKLLRHIVLYKFKQEVTPEQVQEVIDAFVELPKKIDTIVGFEHGPNVSTEGKSDGLTYGFVVTFKSKADLDAYIKHPAHQDYVNIVKDRREKVVVFDFWSGADGTR